MREQDSVPANLTALCWNDIVSNSEGSLDNSFGWIFSRRLGGRQRIGTAHRFRVAGVGHAGGDMDASFTPSRHAQ